MFECTKHPFSIQHATANCPLCAFAREIARDPEIRCAVVCGLINNEIEPPHRRNIYATGYMLKWSCASKMLEGLRQMRATGGRR